MQDFGSQSDGAYFQGTLRAFDKNSDDLQQ
jgi:hypothetical protein